MIRGYQLLVARICLWQSKVNFLWQFPANIFHLTNAGAIQFCQQRNACQQLASHIGQMPNAPKLHRLPAWSSTACQLRLAIACQHRYAAACQHRYAAACQCRCVTACQHRDATASQLRGPAPNGGGGIAPPKFFSAPFQNILLAQFLLTCDLKLLNSKRELLYLLSVVIVT